MNRPIPFLMATFLAVSAVSSQTAPPPADPRTTAGTAEGAADQAADPRSAAGSASTGTAEEIQESEQPEPEPETTSTVPAEDPAVPASQDPTAVASRARETAAEQAQREREREQRRADPFDDIYVYLPEGEFDIRTSRLIRNTLFEGRVNYGFVDGDISTYLRYKYYARRSTWRLGVLDSVGFDSVESGSRDCDRVRGGSILFDDRARSRRHIPSQERP